MKRAVLALLTLVAAAACEGSPVAPPAAMIEPVTYTRDVAPILARHCLGCHSTGGLAPFSLQSFEDVRRMLPAIREETTSRRMPPWGALETPECKPRLPWRNDKRLSAAELETLAAWEAAGAPLGTPPEGADGTTGFDVGVGELPGKTHEVTAGAITVSGDDDTFPCIVFDPHLPDGTLLSGIQLVPSNRAILHHAEVWVEDAGAETLCSAEALARSTLLHIYQPGTSAIDLPDGIAMRLPDNARFVVGAHYSPGGKTQVDEPRIQLRVTNEVPKYLLSTVKGLQLNALPDGPTGPREFRIRPGDRAYVANVELDVPASLDGARIYSVAAHQHLAGIDMKIDLVRPAQGDRAADSQCLLQDRWDFHWAQSYDYEAPIEDLPVLRAGDKIAMRCTYDNSMLNRRLAAEYQARGIPPVDIVLGPEKLDEMCMFIPRVIVEAKGH